MRILVIGSGGREHAIIDKLEQSPLVEQLFIAPGNGGTKKFNVPIGADDIEGLVKFAVDNAIDLVVPGPELPLTLGITDAMNNAGVDCFGPDAWASQLEGSKAFAKEIMLECGVPTARYASFSTLPEARSWLEKNGAPVVLKADGLAAGKGVVVAETLEEALKAAEKLFQISSRVIAEEKLLGEEVSLLCVCNGVDCAPLPSAQDHKAAYDGDKGPNTGGMGAYSPAPILPDSELEKMANLVIRPILAAMAAKGHPFRGVLYAGLMITDTGPRVLEYNVRFGDPECQAILARLKSDLAPLLQKAAKGQPLDEPEFDARSAVGVVLAAGNYPDDYPRELPIYGLEEAAGENVKLFHSGTRQTEGGIVSSGGRVLCATGLGATLEEARKEAYSALAKINMPLGRFRADIAQKGLARLRKLSAKGTGK